MQDGTNEIQIHLSEKSEALSSVFDAVKDTKATEFKFFDDALVDQAVYSITLNVKGACDDEIPLVRYSVDGPDGKLQVR